MVLRVWAAIAFVAQWPAASAAADPAAYLIDDFESPTALENWRAVGGDLALGPGHREHGAVLTYRGASAEALWRPASPLPKRRDPAISLWIRFPPEVEVSLVTQDTSGQILRFPIRATIEYPKAGDWQYAVAPLSPSGFKGRLVEIGVQIRVRAQRTLQGSVSFDDVQLRESSEIFHIDTAAQAEPPSESSELARRLGVNIHLLRDDPALDLARAAGFAFVRMDMMWTNVERGGRFRFAAYDALLRSLDARGMGVLWILDLRASGSRRRRSPNATGYSCFR